MKQFGAGENHFQASLFPIVPVGVPFALCDRDQIDWDALLCYQRSLKEGGEQVLVDSAHLWLDTSAGILQPPTDEFGISIALAYSIDIFKPKPDFLFVGLPIELGHTINRVGKRNRGVVRVLVASLTDSPQYPFAGFVRGYYGDIPPEILIYLHRF